MSNCCLKYVVASCSHDACEPLSIDLGVANADRCVNIEASIRGELWAKEGVNTDGGGVLTILPQWGILKMTGKHIIGIYDCISGDIVNDTCYEVSTVIVYKKC